MEFHTLFTDNGPQFDSNEFKQFQKKWSFQHITSSPCYPQSNGGVERAVQSAKTLMKKAKEAGEDCYLSLLNQRNTPRRRFWKSSATTYVKAY
jgi:transposase InsO family protein